MGNHPSVEERDADMREWQHRGEYFSVISHKFGALQEFKDSKKSREIRERMGIEEKMPEAEDKAVPEGEKEIDSEDEKINPEEGRGARNLRGMVSRNKFRLLRPPYDLDLAYITKRVIAMGFPASGFQSTYRNSRDDVISFLATYHPTHHKIYNLCSEENRYYSAKDFPNIRVSVFPIRDHYPASVYMMFVFCLDAYFYMRENTENVIAVHCKAGKGRTGLMIACFLLFTGLCKSSIKAIKYYGLRRARDGIGISIPSQIRCVQNFEYFLKNELGYDFEREGFDFNERIEYFVHKFDIISLQLKNRLECPFRLLALRITPIVRNFSHPATVSIRFQNELKDFVVMFSPNIKEGIVVFEPNIDIVVNGDFCIEFKKTFLKFKLWINPMFFKQIDQELATTMSVEAEECVAEEFSFVKDRSEFEQGTEAIMPPKSRSDFDKRKAKFPIDASMKMTVVCSKVLKNRRNTESS